MTWINRQADEHRCKLPARTWGDGVKTGDVWECDDCGALHQVKVEYDQRDNDTWFTWTRVSTA